jgi:hypothetical protein
VFVFGAIPFTGVILAHSNEAEWNSFKTNKNNEAFIDRIYLIKVPYCLRVSEEQKIYEKLIHGSELANAPCAPATLEMLARFSVMSRLREHENSSLYSKMRVYDGESLRETDPKAKSLQEYKDGAGQDEGMDGTSTRFAFKILASTGAKRSTALPDVPTFTELGVKGVEATGWFGFFAPKGTPEPIIAKLNAEIAKILATPDMQARFQDAGYAMLGGPPQRLHDMMVDGIDRFGTIIKSVGIEPE